MKITLASVAEQLHRAPESAKLPVDVMAIFGSLSALFGVLTGFFGLLAAIASFLWAAIRLYETKTVQEWLKK